MGADSTTDGQTTMAQLAPRSAGRFGDQTALRHRTADGWADVSYAELAERVEARALGFLALGVEVGDRVCILAETRPDWTELGLAVTSVGAVVVPIYPTNSPEECAWVIGNSGARFVVAEDAAQVAKVDAVRDELPALETIVVIDGSADGARALADVIEQGQEADPAVLAERRDAVALDDPYLIIYTSGTTGKPKGCVLSHAGFGLARQVTEDLGLIGGDDVVYLYLPLAHVFAQVIQACVLETGGSLAYYGGDTRQIVAELADVKPTVLPSVPRIFEKIYAMAVGLVPEGQEQAFEEAVERGVRIQLADAAGEAVSDEDRSAHQAADELLFAGLRGIFGGNLRLAISGAAPIAPDVLRLFYAAGVVVLEGWGMTETSAVGTINLPDAIRFGTVGRALPGVDVRIADDGEVQVKGPILFTEYWENPEATADTMSDDGWLLTGDLGALDDDGFLSITGRKKDIIITAGGKNLTPVNLENDLKQSRWISQAVMYADRKPYPVALVTLDEEEIAPWAEAKGLPADVKALAETDEVRQLIQDELDAANAKYAKVEQIKRFAILDHDFTQDEGLLTPTLKLKRNVVYERYAEAFEDLYS